MSRESMTDFSEAGSTPEEAGTNETSETPTSPRVNPFEQSAGTPSSGLDRNPEEILASLRAAGVEIEPPQPLSSAAESNTYSDYLPLREDSLFLRDRGKYEEAKRGIEAAGGEVVSVGTFEDGELAIEWRLKGESSTRFASLERSEATARAGRPPRRREGRGYADEEADIHEELVEIETEAGFTKKIAVPQGDAAKLMWVRGLVGAIESGSTEEPSVELELKLRKLQRAIQGLSMSIDRDKRLVADKMNLELEARIGRTGFRKAWYSFENAKGIEDIQNVARAIRADHINAVWKNKLFRAAVQFYDHNVYGDPHENIPSFFAYDPTLPEQELQEAKNTFRKKLREYLKEKVLAGGFDDETRTGMEAFNNFTDKEKAKYGWKEIGPGNQEEYFTWVQNLAEQWWQFSGRMASHDRFEPKFDYNTIRDRKAKAKNLTANEEAELRARLTNEEAEYRQKTERLQTLQGDYQTTFEDTKTTDTPEAKAARNAIGILYKDIFHFVQRKSEMDEAGWLSDMNKGNFAMRRLLKFEDFMLSKTREEKFKTTIYLGDNPPFTKVDLGQKDLFSYLKFKLRRGTDVAEVGLIDNDNNGEIDFDRITEEEWAGSSVDFTVFGAAQPLDSWVYRSVQSPDEARDILTKGSESLLKSGSEDAIKKMIDSFQYKSGEEPWETKMQFLINWMEWASHEIKNQTGRHHLTYAKIAAVVNGLVALEDSKNPQFINHIHRKRVMKKLKEIKGTSEGWAIAKNFTVGAIGGLIGSFFKRIAPSEVK